ncbi:colanic acid biosynthesis glycosyltransferase WcaL [Nostoc minutum NIES-26]|uniref:Colanic acid biosynthesis glycosyltransferase WcaL n=1 Tax=Nostoc minutum NIES-26 TaxID=1844469 RepID=A0A367QKD9_9NOSO|nr:colanic acid biosynthesis glycosyltransferase WcaL [Nostoc minutum NIES-26]
MKIAFIVAKFPLLSETFILNQITGLIERGHEVDIYGMISNDNLKVHPAVEKYHLLTRTYYHPLLPKNYFWRLVKCLGLILVNFPRAPLKAPLVVLRSLNIFKYGRRAASLRLLYSVIRFLEAKPYDIIHCQFGTLALDCMIWQDIGAIQGKLITSFRGYDISWFIQQQGEHVYDSLFANGDFFLANCEYFKIKAMKLGCDEKKIVVHGSGVDCNQFTFKERHSHTDGKFRITTTGRLVEKKGIEYGIRAVAKLAKLGKDIEYNIIGDGCLKENLQQLIYSLNVADRVKLLGWKNQPEVIEILNNSDIFMALSVTAEDGNQDAPVNTLKEAMLMGLPVIATLHGGIPELVKDGVSGFLVPERDSDAIAEKLTYLIAHPEIWSSMGQAGRAFVEANYDMNKLNDELVQIYQQVLMQDLLVRQEEALASVAKLRYKA